MRRSGKSKKNRKAKRLSVPTQVRFLKKKGLTKEPPRPQIDPASEQQLKAFEEGVQNFHLQKYAKAKPIFEKVLNGPGKDIADPARVHRSIIDQRLQRSEPVVPRTPEEHYQQGVAMMNMGRCDEAREHLLRARKLAPKADYVIYAMAARDCLTGEAESAMENLKLAIQLRPENRYHARNDEDFAFLQADPRFTELLYPDRDASGT